MKVASAGLQVQKLTYTNLILFPFIALGRAVLRMAGGRIHSLSENDLTPDWMNGLLGRVFASERGLLRHVDFPLGVSLMCLATKGTRG